MYFSTEQSEMLYELHYQGAFIEFIKNGDRIAIRNLGSWREGEPEILFVTVDCLNVIPRDRASGPLMQFIGVHENGRREPMSYGAGYPVAIMTEAS